jgi:hypothetical protein
MHRQALGLAETVLGNEHPSTLTSMNLAEGMRDQGKYEHSLRSLQILLAHTPRLPVSNLHPKPVQPECRGIFALLLGREER